MSDPAKLLAELRRPEVFAAGFPKRRRLTHAEMEQLSKDEQHASLLLGVEAISRVKDTHALADIARRLGAVKYEEAISILAAIWRDSALVPLRRAAGHALLEIGTTAAHEVLIELVRTSALGSGIAQRRPLPGPRPETQSQRPPEPGG